MKSTNTNGTHEGAALLKRSAKYVGVDVHQATTVVAVRDENGRLIFETILERGRAQWLAKLPCGARPLAAVTQEINITGLEFKSLTARGTNPATRLSQHLVRRTGACQQVSVDDLPRSEPKSTASYSADRQLHRSVRMQSRQATNCQQVGTAVQVPRIASSRSSSSSCR
jgi:hypothetical protein